ncbi:hypothetical protein WJX81_003210 [Elliptochloris bilobata]|uniref:Phosphatidylinositol-3,4,5-trisphosphate 3-phosphatase n=1 Tax=Elliptochloris bilobata TaxID=381761 RepID=A0AAW1RCD1_9CHLO
MAQKHLFLGAAPTSTAIREQDRLVKKVSKAISAPAVQIPFLALEQLGSAGLTTNKMRMAGALAPHSACQGPIIIKGQVLHSISAQRLDVVNSMEDHVDRTVLPILKDVKACWQPTDFLPDSSSPDFVDEVVELRKRAASLPDDYLVVLVGDMITEEALPTYMAMLNTLDGVRDQTGAEQTPWGRWNRQWTAEENRHGDLMNKYCYLTGRVNMKAIEVTIQRLIGSGMDPKTENNPYLGFIYTSFQERATKISHGNTAAHAAEHGDKVLGKICAAIAGDEARHEKAYIKIVDALFERDPSGTMTAFADMMRKQIVMPAHYMDDLEHQGRTGRSLFKDFSSVAQMTGTYTGHDYVDIMEFLMKHWRISELTGLTSEAAKAQDDLSSLLIKFRKLTNRNDRILKSKATVPTAFSWIFNREDSGVDWQAVKRWLVFSDLHVSTKTVDTCCQVLRCVREEAAARDAGVLFLGDFWHARGALPVVALNSVLAEFRTWAQPTLMLVGNHDQVTLSGLDHGLTPIAEACASVHVFDRPSVFLDALWLPFRRDPAELEACVRACGPVRAIFGHADVLGAFVNETFQAREGLPPELFPAEIPTYLGHYHKPHMVGNTRVQYVGSPYEVSRSEAGQQKALLVLDAAWREVERIPLDLGARHFSLASAVPALPAHLRSGDRVRWTLPEPEMLDTAGGLVADLRSRGVDVEVVLPPPAAAPRVPLAEDMSALALFATYADRAGLSPEAAALGAQILQEVAGQGQALRHEPADVQLDSLQIEGYGPFRDVVQYPLGARGVLVVCGRNEDDAGADSNGAGKSALVMAPLWALTGRSDARAEGSGGRGLTAADVVNDDMRSARVRVEGTVNGERFVVERITRRKQLARLTFELGGTDCTGADARLTQAAIEARLAASMLARVAFHGQADVNGLLEADDKRFKEELGRVVDLDVWEAAKAVAVERLRAARTAAAQAEREQQVRRELAEKLAAQSAEAGARGANWEAARAASAREAEEAAESEALVQQLRSEAAALSDRLARERTDYGGALGAWQASSSALAAYAALGDASGLAAAVCDRCLRPVDGATFAANLSRLRADEAAANAARSEVEQQVVASQAQLHTTDERVRGMMGAAALRAQQARTAEQRAAAAAAAAVAAQQEAARRAERSEPRERSLRQLSGGERRRVGLALALGFSELIAARGRLRCNLIVLDEVLQQLDGEGCARVAAVLRGLPQESVLVVGQANSFVTEAFDAADVATFCGIEVFHMADIDVKGGDCALLTPSDYEALEELEYAFIVRRINLKPDLLLNTKEIPGFGTGVARLFRNSAPEVLSVLESKHAGHFRVYNLCAERTYPAARLGGHVVHLPCEDHQAPPLALLQSFCDDAAAHLAANLGNVCVVHCKAGKGRTGVFISALFLHLGICRDVDAALQLYTAKRMRVGAGVTIPSQIRFLRYFADQSSAGPAAGVTSEGLHAAPVAGARVVADSAGYAIAALRSCNVEGEVKVEVQREALGRTWPLFNAWLSTAYLAAGDTVLTRCELDKVKTAAHHATELRMTFIESASSDAAINRVPDVTLH